jgi:hypothetical protein
MLVRRMLGWIGWLTQLCWPSGRKDLGFGLVGLAVVDAVEFGVGVRRWRLDAFVAEVVLLALEVLPLVEVPDGLRRVIVAF